ncbi:hypothetical protein GCM10010349_42800 [Streptomyces flavofungini]|nr:hypothetical protein GCM10010349_42800 [Streptomyces flavofungini]
MLLCEGAVRPGGRPVQPGGRPVRPEEGLSTRREIMSGGMGESIGPRGPPVHDPPRPVARLSRSPPRLDRS